MLLKQIQLCIYLNSNYLILIVINIPYKYSYIEYLGESVFVED